MRDSLENVVNENYMLTLTAINAELRRRLPEKPDICERTVGNHLDGMLYSLKLAYRRPTERNRPDVIERRHEYACWFLEEANLQHTLFVDECGFNMSYGPGGVRDENQSRTRTRDPSVDSFH